MIAQFKITYENGISQVKNIMGQDYYEYVYKKELQERQENEEILAKMKRPKPGTPQFVKYMELQNNISLSKKCCEGVWGEFFTSESPLGRALSNSKHMRGLLELPASQGGTHKVSFERIR